MTPHVTVCVRPLQVAPANSTVDRTLDQQCTVTRPGLAPVASALAVEMAVSLIHAPLGAATPPPAAAGGRMGDASGNSQEADSTLGRLPHQVRPHCEFAIKSPPVGTPCECSSQRAVSHSTFRFTPPPLWQVRGFLSRWDQLCVASPAFEQCTACSRTAVGAFRADRKSFLLGAFNKVCSPLSFSWLIFAQQCQCLCRPSLLPKKLRRADLHGPLATLTAVIVS